MKEKFLLVVGFVTGIGIAYWVRVIAAPHAWVLFYR